MSNLPWQPRSALGGAAVVDTSPETGGTIGVTLRELPGRSALLVIARNGQAAAVAARIRDATGPAPPTRPEHVISGETEAIWSGPDQWLLMSRAGEAAAKLRKLELALAGLASCSEQTDARVLLSLAGPASRRTLMKLVGIDLHDTAFPVGSAAMTSVAHIASYLWRLADVGGAPAYEIASPRSTAGSLWEAIIAAAAAHGLDARPAQPAAAK